MGLSYVKFNSLSTTTAALVLELQLPPKLNKDSSEVESSSTVPFSSCAALG